MTAFRFLVALLCLPLGTLSSQVPVGSAVQQIVGVLTKDGHIRGPLIVAAMPNCQRDLEDPTCLGIEYTDAGRRAAYDVATRLATAVAVPVSDDIASARAQLVVLRDEVGTAATCHAEGNIVRTLQTSAPVIDGNGRTFRIGVTVQQLPLLSGCRSFGRLYEYAFEVPAAGGEPVLTGYRPLHSGTGIPTGGR